MTCLIASFEPVASRISIIVAFAILAWGIEGSALILHRVCFVRMPLAFGRLFSLIRPMTHPLSDWSILEVISEPVSRVSCLRP